MTGKDRERGDRKLTLVDPAQESEGAELEREDLEATAEALAAAHLGGAGEAAEGAEGDLDVADHEVLLALALGDDVAEIAEDERDRAEQLRAALEGRGADPLAELAESLRLAHQSATGTDGTAALPEVDHEALIALCTGLPLEEQVSDTERDESQALRVVLEGEGAHPLAELAEALVAAAGQGPDLDELSHARVLRQAMKSGETEWERQLQQPAPARRATPGLGMVFAALVAVAAGVALFFGSLSWLETQGLNPVAERPELPAPLAAELVLTRSTQDLFDPATPFPSKGGESERLGKIVASRAADLRANRFAAWGVR